MPTAEPLHPDDPEAIAAYRIVGRLGEGGQGVVYLGQAQDGRPVAVKVLRHAVGGDDRFAKEIAAARRVEPFCIAQVLDASLGARPYIVSEYVEGPSLQQAGRHHGADLQRLAVSTATALAAIHEAGIVHRDFKPANVLLGRDGPRVIDFGIARAADSAMTVTSSIVGTPAYMAPEQLAGVYVGPAADVFAWACVVVFASAGTPPFGNDSLPAVLNRILNAEPFLGDLAEPLRSIVYACLAKDPAARPRMQDVLLRLIGGRPQPVLQQSPSGLSPQPVLQQSPSGLWSQQPQPGPWLGPGGGDPNRHTLPPSRGTWRLPLIAGVSAGTAVCLVAGVVVWYASTGPGAGTSPALALGSSQSSPSTHVSTPVKHKTTPPRKKHTPTPTPTTPHPTPSRERTTPAPAKTVTRKPTATAKPKAAPWEVINFLVLGSPKVNQYGETCYPGDVSFGVSVTGAPGASFSYEWLLENKVIESGSKRIPSTSTGLLVTSKRKVSVTKGEAHQVMFTFKSPVQESDSRSWVAC